MKGVIYCRISSKDSKSSIENQLKICKMIGEKENYELEIIIDVGYSGSNMNRPGMTKLMNYINEVNDNKKSILNEKRIDCIIVKDISRLGRNYIEVGELINKIVKANIRLIFANDSNVECMDMQMDINSLMADFYSKDISIKTKSILDMNKKKGIYSINKVPYGYRKSKKDKYKIEIYEKEAKNVRYIYESYNNGKKIREIVDDLNKLEEFSGQSMWTYHKVYRILHNEFYKGTMVYGKTSGHIWEGKNRKYNKKEDWVRIKNHHKAII